MRANSHTGKTNQQKKQLIKVVKSVELESTVLENEDDCSTDKPLDSKKTIKNSKRRPRKKTKIIAKWIKENAISVIGVLFVGAIIWISVDSKIEVSKHDIRLDGIDDSIKIINQDIKDNNEIITQLRISMGKYEVLIQVPKK